VGEETEGSDAAVRNRKRCTTEMDEERTIRYHLEDELLIDLKRVWCGTSYRSLSRNVEDLKRLPLNVYHVFRRSPTREEFEF